MCRNCRSGGRTRTRYTLVSSQRWACAFVTCDPINLHVLGRSRGSRYMWSISDGRDSISSDNCPARSVSQCSCPPLLPSSPFPPWFTAVKDWSSSDLHATATKVASAPGVTRCNPSFITVCITLCATEWLMAVARERRCSSECKLDFFQHVSSRELVS